MLEFAHRLEAFTLNYYQPGVIKVVGEFLTFEVVQLDGAHAILIKIEYINDIAGDTTNIQEVFLDIGDAHVISKTILNIINTTKSYVINSY